jgi:MFS family permease
VTVTLRFHYAWVVAAVGLLSILACLGIGRFSLGMLLPSMGADLGLTYAQMGFISTGNFIGYLLAVLLCSELTRRLGARVVIFLALLTVGTTLLALSRAQGFAAVLALYLLTGVGSGAANVPTMGLVSHWFTRRWRGLAAGVMVSGSGFAIMLAGLLVPQINARWHASGWRYGWAILGAIVVAIALVASALLRNTPAERGLAALGAGRSEPAGEPPAPHPAYRRNVLAHLGAIYFLFGFTYVIYATFIVTTLVNERGFSESVAGRFWFWVGLLSLFSGPAFGGLSDRVGRRVGLAAVFAVHATSYLLVGLQLPEPFVYLSIALFGFAAWSVPGIMAAAVGDYLGPANAVAGFATITFVFALGQVIGPALAGLLAQASGTFASSYLMAAAMAATALVLSFALKPPR